MKLTIETENPAEIVAILAALTGSTAATPALKAADKPKAEKPAAPPTAVTTIASVAVQPEPIQTTVAPPTPAATNNIPDEAALTAAANAAIAKLGPGAQGKIKEYIGATYKKDDGSPAGLRTVKVEQRAGLLADLNAFASGAKVI